MSIYFFVVFVIINIVALTCFCISTNTFKRKNIKTKYYVVGVEYDSLEEAEKAKQYLLNIYKDFPNIEKYLEQIKIIQFEQGTF